MKNIKLSPLFIVYVFFFSCQRDVSFSENKNEIPESIILKLQANGFVTSRGLAKYREGYLVEYDIYLTKSEINNLSDSKGKSSGSRIEQYRSNNLVSASRVIRVYMDPLFGVFMQNAFNTALGRYNQLNLCLRLS